MVPLNPKTPPTRRTRIDYVAELERRGGRLFCTDNGSWYARLNNKQARGRSAAEAAEKVFSEKI